MSWLSDLFNPPAANVPTPQINSYQPANFGGADSGAFGGISNLGQFNQYASLNPQVQGIAQGLVNNPYAGSYLSGAGTAAGLGQMGALGAYGQGANLYGLGGALANTAFDPQGALYDRTVQRVQDQTRAGLEARGLDNTPYGAGVEGQTLGNFNIDWQNQQLQRQLQGAQGAGSLIQQGAGLQAGAPGAYYSASGLPYSTFQGIGASNLGTLGTAGQFGAAGAQIPQQQIQDYLSYLGWGTGAQNAANQAQLGLGKFELDQANQAFNQQQTIFGDLGKVAGMIAPAALAPFTGGASLSMYGVPGLSSAFGFGGGGAGKGIG